MPPNTGVPTAWRVMAPAPSAMTRGNSPKMNAKLVIITGRNRQACGLYRSCVDILSQTTLLHSKGNDQNTVLRGQRDQHHQPDLRIDVEAQSSRDDGDDGAENRDADRQ